jgi:hypothetical protein
MVLHTWDQVLQAHFHLHALVPGGALADGGMRWAPTHPKFLFPVKALGKVFRGQFLGALQEPTITQALCFNESTAHLSTQAGFVNLSRLISSQGNRRDIWDSIPTDPDARPSASYP